MMSGLSIEQLRPDHCASISRLLEDNNREEITSHFHPFPMTRDTAEKLCLGRFKDLYYIAFLGETAIGLAMSASTSVAPDAIGFHGTRQYRF